jgi:hypothetical protein
LTEGSRVEKGRATGCVLHTDGFGNAITNIAADALGSWPPKRAAEVRIEETGPIRMPCVATYSDVPPDDVGLLVASSGFLEIAMNGDSAADALGIEPGAPVDVRLPATS